MNKHLTELINFLFIALFFSSLPVWANKNCLCDFSFDESPHTASQKNLKKVAIYIHLYTQKSMIPWSEGQNGNVVEPGPRKKTSNDIFKHIYQNYKNLILNIPIGTTVDIYHASPIKAMPDPLTNIQNQTMENPGLIGRLEASGRYTEEAKNIFTTLSQIKTINNWGHAGFDYTLHRNIFYNKIYYLTDGSSPDNYHFYKFSSEEYFHDISVHTCLVNPYNYRKKFFLHPEVYFHSKFNSFYDLINYLRFKSGYILNNNKAENRHALPKEDINQWIELYNSDIVQEIITKNLSTASNRKYKLWLAEISKILSDFYHSPYLTWQDNDLPKLKKIHTYTFTITRDLNNWHDDGALFPHQNIYTDEDYRRYKNAIEFESSAHEIPVVISQPPYNITKLKGSSFKTISSSCLDRSFAKP